VARVSLFDVFEGERAAPSERRRQGARERRQTSIHRAKDFLVLRRLLATVSRQARRAYSRLGELGKSRPKLGRRSLKLEKGCPNWGEDSLILGKGSRRWGRGCPDSGKSSPTSGESSPTWGRSSPIGGEAAPESGKRCPTSGKGSPAGGKSSPIWGRSSPGVSDRPADPLALQEGGDLAGELDGQPLLLRPRGGPRATRRRA
jgi:hypothetical protein